MPEAKESIRKIKGIIQRVKLTLFFCLIITSPTLAADSAQFSSQSVPATMVCGQSYSISVTFKNTGTTTWTKASKYKLGSQNPQDNLTWVIGRVLLNNTERIKPRRTKTFKFTIKAPATAGTYNFQWQMLKEGVAWFGSKTSNLKIKVSAPVKTTPSSATNSTPSVGTITPSSITLNALQALAFTTTYSDPDGYLDIKTALLLINTKVDAANGFYAYYDQVANKLYLVDDTGTQWLGGYAPGSFNSIENSYAKLDCWGSSVKGSGATLTIAWQISFKYDFTGSFKENKNIYLKIVDRADSLQDWTKVGTLRLLEQASAGEALSPSSGSSLSNQPVTFATTYGDLNGYADIQEVQLVFHTQDLHLKTTLPVDTKNSLWLIYNQNTNQLYIIDDTGATWQGGIIPGTKNTTISNSYASLDCEKTTVSASGNYLTVNWAVTFKSTFTGAKNIYLYAKDDAGNYQGWTPKGAWTTKNITPQPFLTTEQHSLLRELLDTHLNYFLSDDVITGSGLPLTAYKELDRGRYGYSNPTEWGYSLLAWIIAAENNKVSKQEVSLKIEKALDTMLALQGDPLQNYQNLFYPYYYVTDRQGNDLLPPYHDPNVWIPSIDNGFLYTSLLITEGWAQINDLSNIETKAGSIKDKMNFSIFLQQDKSYLVHLINAQTRQLSSSKWDVYADEGGVMAWIAYLSGSVTFDEYKQLINSMLRPSKSWNNIFVDEAAWFNAMFAWGVRSWAGFPVATWEADTTNLYSSASFAQAVKAHLTYGNWLVVDYPAFSDAMTQIGMTGRYTPPNIPNNIPADIPSHIVPHALFVPFCIGPDLDPADITTLVNKITDLKNDLANYYHYGQDTHKPFGFEVTASPFKDTTSYNGVESRYIYETLSNAYIVMSLSQGLNINDGKSTLFHFALQIPGYFDRVKEVLGFLYSEPRTLKVPSEYSTIQSAVDAASRGDTIEIAAGRYLENIVISKSKLTLKGTIGDYNNALDSNLNTVIDSNTGLGFYTGLGIYLNRSSATTLDGLVITGARREFYSSNGGGIYSYYSDDIVISNSILTGNIAAYGAGICAYESKRILISNNIFTQNTGHYGGAIWIGSLNAEDTLTATVIDNKIINNLAWAEGAGIEVYKTNVSICNNLIYNNVSDWAAGLYLISAKGEIKNNLIVKNYADYQGGGGLYCKDSSVLVVNNVIYKNRGFGGVYIYGDITPVIKNNIITENWYGICYTGNNPPSLTYNDVYNNTNKDYDYVGCSAGIGSISASPLFVAPDNDSNPDNDDYHLQLTSPSIDAGDPDPQHNDKDGSRNDMGIYGGPNPFPF